MRIIVIRHAQSSNNVLSEISYDIYANGRTEDPMITEKGEEEAIVIGRFLKNNNFKIDKCMQKWLFVYSITIPNIITNITLVFSSASQRSLLTMNIIANVYNKETPKELFLEIHEFGGVYKGVDGMPGMNADEIKAKVPEIIIPNEDSLMFGWWKSDTKETEEAFKDRVKKAINKLKDLAKVSEEDYTVCIITHGLFMNAFFSSMLGCELLVDSKNLLINFNLNFTINSLILDLNFGFKNLSISSVTISQKKEIKLEFLNFGVDEEIVE